MEQQHESDVVKRLEQLGIEVDVSPTGTSLTAAVSTNGVGPQINVSGR